MEQCLAYLRTLTSESLAEAPHAELLAVGSVLFRSHVLREAFGTDDVLEHLKSQSEYKELLRKLEKLSKKINDVHEGHVRKAKFAGINTQRSQSWMAFQAGEPATALLDTPGSTPAALPAAPPATAPSDAPVAARAPLPAAAAAPAPQVDIDAVRRAASLPPGSFQQSCNICGSALAGGHHFYHQLCVGCGDLNFAKRNALAPMSGKVAVVTGGRVRIGAQCGAAPWRAGPSPLSPVAFRRRLPHRPQAPAVRLPRAHDHAIPGGRGGAVRSRARL